MSYVDAPSYGSIASGSTEERSAFIVRTYTHLLGAISAFLLLESWLFTSGIAERIAAVVAGVGWLLVLGAFIVVSWLASRMAHNLDSPVTQYLGLGIFIVAEALIFAPLIWWAEAYSDGVVGTAGILAITGFTALTVIAFATRKDFSFMRPFLMWAGLIALGLIVVSVLTGFDLGPLFALGMIGFAGAAILHDTSNVLHHFRGDQHVGAALELFASFALLLWYLISLVSSFGGD